MYLFLHALIAPDSGTVPVFVSISVFAQKRIFRLLEVRFAV